MGMADRTGVIPALAENAIADQIVLVSWAVHMQSRPPGRARLASYEHGFAHRINLEISGEENFVGRDCAFQPAEQERTHVRGSGRQTVQRDCAWA